MKFELILFFLVLKFYIILYKNWYYNNIKFIIIFLLNLNKIAKNI